MSLSESKLLVELRIFGDPEYSGYTQYPETRVKARRAWAKAFYNYLKDMECTSPAGTTDPSKTPDIGACENLFFTTLKLPIYATVQSAAKDYSEAWNTSMMGMILVPGGLYAGSPINPIISITPLSSFISTQKPILYAGFLKIFTSYQSGYPINTHLEQLKKIAKIIHDATLNSGGPTTCTYTIPSLPGTATGPLLYT